MEEIFVIVDTYTATFWKSANKKTSWPTAGTAKSAYGSSQNNKTNSLFGNQSRFRIAKVTTAGLDYV